MKKIIYTVKGVTGTLPELCQYFKISPNTVKTRLRRGFSIEEALLTPVQEKILNAFTRN